METIYNDYLEEYKELTRITKIEDRTSYQLNGIITGIRINPKINRNSVCPKCNSGKKYKKCCGKDNIAKINHETK